MKAQRTSSFIGLLAAMALGCRSTHARDGDGAPGSATEATASAAAPIRLTASDGVAVHGWLTASEDKSKRILLLFHQAGSNHAEYDPIVPSLVKEGWSTLALDQRSGGDRFGSTNRTATELGHEATYRDALEDLRAAVIWARTSGYTGTIAAWGSSYSAALVFLLAASEANVGAVLAFSPDEYLGAGPSVHDAASRVTVPVFVTSAPAEAAAARAIFDAVPSKAKTQYVPRVGVHGASTLRVDADPAGAAANLDAVLAFLRGLGRAPAMP